MENPTPAATLTWCHDDTKSAHDANADTTHTLDAMISAGNREDVVASLEPWPASSLVALLVNLRTKRAQKLLGWLPDDLGLRLLVELDPRLREVLFDDATILRFRQLMDRADAKLALRLLEQLPEDYTEELLARRDDAESLRLALRHGEDSAAAHLRKGSMVLRSTWTIDEVVEDVRTRSEQIEKLEGLYVIDDEGRLTGFLRIRDLLLHPGESVVGDIQRSDPVAVSGDTDQEKVLALAKERHVAAIAVVNSDNQLLGTITQTELAEIAREEAEEDMLLMGGVSPDSTGFDTPLQIVRRRLPWLLAGLVGAMIAAAVIGSYEDALTEAAILASFIPVVMATAGNAGMQASTVSIQAITQGAAWRGDMLPRLGREIVGAITNGLLLGVCVCAAITIASLMFEIERPMFLALSVASALVCVIVLAGAIGSAVPFGLKAAGLDPAVATGIFILTANDVFGVLIYFVIASHLYL